MIETMIVHHDILFLNDAKAHKNLGFYATISESISQWVTILDIELLSQLKIILKKGKHISNNSPGLERNVCWWAQEELYLMATFHQLHFYPHSTHRRGGPMEIRETPTPSRIIDFTPLLPAKNSTPLEFWFVNKKHDFSQDSDGLSWTQSVRQSLKYCFRNYKD